MPKQKPHVLLLSVGLVLLFGFTACVMAKTYIAYSKQLNRMAVIQTAFENMAFCRPYELSSEGFCLSPTTVLTRRAKSHLCRRSCPRMAERWSIVSAE